MHTLFEDFSKHRAYNERAKNLDKTQVAKLLTHPKRVSGSFDDILRATFLSHFRAVVQDGTVCSFGPISEGDAMPSFVSTGDELSQIVKTDKPADGDCALELAPDLDVDEDTCLYEDDAYMSKRVFFRLPCLQTSL
jgi:hypothetical protein